MSTRIRREIRTFVQGLASLIALLLCTATIIPLSNAGTPFQAKQETKEQGSPSPEELAETKALFSEKCAKCHGVDGRGETGLGKMVRAPNFTDEKWWKGKKEDKRFITSITDGKDDMPSFRKKLSKEQIQALVAYLRGFNKSAR